MTFVVMILCVVLCFVFYRLGKQEGRKEVLQDLNKACNIALSSIKKEELANMKMSDVAKEVFNNFKSSFKQLIGG